MSERNTGEMPEVGAVGRRVAEWITLSVSTLLILGIAGYLVYEMTRSGGPHVTVEARVLFAEVRHEGGRHILPIEIENPGRRTLRDVQIEVRLRPPNGPRETRELTIDYLGEKARQKVYLYLDWPPKPGSVRVAPLLYRVE